MHALIVDDDPISLRFLEAALQQLGCTTVGVAGMAAALALPSSSRFDLLLLDRNMPDGSGIDLLTTLRRHGVECPAVATSAEITPQTRALLRAAGFVDCVEKPVTLTRLQQVLRRWLDKADIALLDDTTALTAIGNDRAALRALRGMLVQELGVLQSELAGSKTEITALLERLHRLRASCGFCGTPKLAAATIALEQALRADPANAAAPQQEFLACCADTIDALRR